MNDTIEKVHYSEIEKLCIVCGDSLVLNNNRDVERKKFCSKSCRGKYGIYQRCSGEGVCVICGRTFTKKQNNQNSCGSKECAMLLQVERSYKMMNDNPEKYIKHLMQKPQRKHIPVEYIMGLLESQGGKCAISGEEMTFIKIRGQPKVHTNLSIDRIDSSIGYEIGNIQLVCAVVNVMKTTLSSEELLSWCGKIIDNSKEV